MDGLLTCTSFLTYVSECDIKQHTLKLKNCYKGDLIVIMFNNMFRWESRLRNSFIYYSMLLSWISISLWGRGTYWKGALTGIGALHKKSNTQGGALNGGEHLLEGRSYIESLQYAASNLVQFLFGELKRRENFTMQPCTHITETK